MRSSTRRCSYLIGVIAFVIVAGGFAACRSKQPEAPPVATASVTLARTRVALGSPLDFTYTFVVAENAHFDQDERVMMHVIDADDELIWTDDHNPPKPTTRAMLSFPPLSATPPMRAPFPRARAGRTARPQRPACRARSTRSWRGRR